MVKPVDRKPRMKEVSGNPVIKSTQPLALTARQRQLLKTLLDNLIDVSIDASVRRDAKNLLRKLKVSHRRVSK